MGVALKVACLILLVVGFTQASVLPVEKCTLKDKACMVPAVQKMLPVFLAGMPEYSVDVLDPMELSDLKFDLSGLQFSLSGGILKGLKSADIEAVEWDTEKKVFAISFHADVSVKGHYTAAGRVLILPITGDGQMKLKMKTVYIKIFVHYKTEKKDDKEYLKPTKYSFEFEVKENTNFHLTNLFNGNKELSDAMLIFLNDNWKQISVEFGQPLVNIAVKELYKNIASLLEKVPIEEIANV